MGKVSYTLYIYILIIVSLCGSRLTSCIRKCVFWELLEHSLGTVIRSGFLGLRYVVWLCNKGRKGRGLCLPPVCPYGRRIFCIRQFCHEDSCREVLWFVRGCATTRIRKDLLPKERRGCGKALWRRDLGVLAGNRGNGYATHLCGPDACWGDLLCPHLCAFIFLLRFQFSTLHASMACLLAHAMDACLNLSSLVRQ